MYNLTIYLCFDLQKHIVHLINHIDIIHFQSFHYFPPICTEHGMIDDKNTALIQMHYVISWDVEEVIIIIKPLWSFRFYLAIYVK